MKDTGLKVGRTGAGTYGVTFNRLDGSRIAGAVVTAASLDDAINRATTEVFGPGTAPMRDPRRNLMLIRNVDTGSMVVETRLRVDRQGMRGVAA